MSREGDNGILERGQVGGGRKGGGLENSDTHKNKDFQLIKVQGGTVGGREKREGRERRERERGGRERGREKEKKGRKKER